MQRVFGAQGISQFLVHSIFPSSWCTGSFPVFGTQRISQILVHIDMNENGYAKCVSHWLVDGNESKGLVVGLHSMRNVPRIS